MSLFVAVFKYNLCKRSSFNAYPQGKETFQHLYNKKHQSTSIKRQLKCDGFSFFGSFIFNNR